MTSDSASHLATQQSIKAYVDAQVGGITGATGNELENVVEDTTPQLGGNLDVNGNSIVSVSAGNISITPDTTGSVIIDGLSHPQADGTAGQFLKTDGAGQLAFATVTQATGNELENVVEDTTPQLGGDLQSNGSDIVMADDDAVIIGTDTDLTVVHDSGVGNTLFKSDSLEFKSKANANLTFKIAPGATKAAVLYYQGSERLAIESGTSRFTGGINTDTATIASLAYPTSDGTNGQVLTTNGSGTLSFQDVTESDPSALAFAIALG